MPFAVQLLEDATSAREALDIAKHTNFTAPAASALRDAIAARRFEWLAEVADSPEVAEAIGVQRRMLEL